VQPPLREENNGKGAQIEDKEETRSVIRGGEAATLKVPSLEKRNPGERIGKERRRENSEEEGAKKRVERLRGHGTTRRIAKASKQEEVN